MATGTPQAFGKHRLVRRIGEGGMATIFLATLEGPDGFSKPCVVKRIRSVFSSNPRFRRMLSQEARVAALLSHPNIVQVFDFGEVDDENFISMEYVEGASMSAIARLARRDGQPLGTSAVIQLGLAVSDALDYIHAGVSIDGQRTPLVHRDVSPSNILVSVRGAVKLTDFGIVKILQTPGMTESGVVKGKYGYMSPEQVKGQVLDGRSDIFALGTVLWELVTGRPLFRRPDVAATIAAVLAGRVPRLADVAPEAPMDLQPILERALASDRKNRYRSARELHDDLGALVTNDDVAEARRELATRATNTAAAIAASGFDSDLPGRFEGSFTGPVHASSYELRALAGEEDDEGYASAIWIGLVTTAVVASILVWLMVLR